MPIQITPPVPFYHALQNLLELELSKNFPDKTVELGKNWELIARLFYTLGHQDALYGETKNSALLISPARDLKPALNQP